MTYLEKKQTYASNNQIIMLALKDIITRQELCDMLHCSDAEARTIIRECSHLYPVIFHSKIQKGYRLAKPLDDISQKDLINEIAEVESTIKELNSRVEMLNARLKPLIAYLSVAKGMIVDVEN